MTISNILTNEDVRNYVKLKLGYPVINVELTDPQIDMCITDALLLFNRYLSCVRTSVVYSVSDTTQITLDDDITGIVYLNFIQPYYINQYDRLNLFDIITRMVYPGGINIEEWYTYKTYFKMFQKIRGSEPNWFYYPDTRTLVLDAHGGPWDVFYIANADITLRAILQDSKRKYINHFLTACLGYAKMNMSLIRRKFGGIPAPGGNLSSDGDKLQTEGEEIVKSVEDKLLKLADTKILPIIG